jgi:hypothetical protein
LIGWETISFSRGILLLGIILLLRRNRKNECFDRTIAGIKGTGLWLSYWRTLSLASSPVPVIQQSSSIVFPPSRRPSDVTPSRRSVSPNLLVSSCMMCVTTLRFEEDCQRSFQSLPKIMLHYFPITSEVITAKH